MANPIITKIQIEGNNVVSFLNGTNYVRSMSQILPQNPTYISYRYDSITISQIGGEAFTFSIYTITDVGGLTFTELTIQDSADVVQAKTVEIYRLLVTSIFKGCCPCGDEIPQCAIQYVVGDPEAPAPLLGEFVYTSGTPGAIAFNYITGNNQDFTNFFPTVQDGSWIFLFSKTDPTVYAIIQVSNFTDLGTYAKFDAIELNAAGLPFPIGTIFCVDFTSVGGSLVQDWQDTLNISSLLTQNNTVDGGGFDFVFDNNNSFTINGPGGSVEVDVAGPSLNAGSQQILVTSGYIDIITPSYASASTGWVLALTAAGHVEYVEAGTGTISSIELIMPPAFTVSDPNPLTTDGTFTVTVDGTIDQYINGLGELADFPIYTVENGLHTKESPADPKVFHLGGTLIEDTTITVTNGASEWAFGVSGLAAQDTQVPFGVSNLGQAGVATFQDYAIGSRTNPSVLIVGDNDTWRPLLDLELEGPLPNPGNPNIWENHNSFLRLKHTGDTEVGARMAIDYTFRNTSSSTNPELYLWPAVKLIAEATNVTENSETSNFSIRMFDGGSQQDKMLLEGKGQLTLNEYGTGLFSDGTTNINNSLTYLLGTDNTGKVWKKLATAGGTVQSVSGTGLITTSPNPITTTGTVTTNMATNRLVGRYSPGSGIMQEITIGAGLALSAGGELTADGTVPVYSVINGLHTQESPPDNKVFHLGGNLIEDTFIYNNGNDFTIERGNIGVALYVNNVATGGTNTFRTAIQATSTDGLAGDFYAGNVLYPIYDIEPVVQINRTTTLPPDAEYDYNEIGGSIDFTNPTVTGAFATQIPWSSRIASRWSLSRNEGGFSPQLPVGRLELWNFDGSGSQLLSATFNAGLFSRGPSSGGLNQFNQYGQGNFYDLLTPVYGLAVDQDGYIIEVDLGGGGGTYTVNNGLTENPANNFQLGGDLIKDTIVSGDGNQWRMTFDEMLRFTANANSRISLRVEELDPLSPNFGSFTLYQATNQVVTISSYNNTTTTTHSLALEAGNVSGIQGPLTSFTVTDSKLNVKTPNVTGGSATVGQVLTLMDLVTGEAEFQDAGGGGTYTADNGITPLAPTPPSTTTTFQLGGPLVQDTTILGASYTYDLSFNELDFFGVTAGGKIEMYGVDPTDPSVYSQFYAAWPSAVVRHVDSGGESSFTAQTSNAIMSYSDGSTLTNSVYADGSGSGMIHINSSLVPPGYGIDVKSTGIFIRTPGVYGGSVTNGQVLTLIDAATGQSEWQDGGGGGGIPFAVASGTDTYTATVSGVTAYTDGDAYLIRFTNGNTDSATLNINSLGARPLHQTNQVPLIGGDIWDGGEMLCIYNATDNSFECIGTAPNSLFAYVTNAEGSTISKGQAVYAFGGIGNRMTVKLARANQDSTSAQTIGFVFSSSIGINQKGIIIIQGYFTGLNLFPPASGWLDGDPVYLSPTTAGAVTRTKPYAPSHLVYLGVVATASAGSSGRMYVRVQNGYELDELHNVQAQSPSLNDTLWYDSSVSPGQWKTASIPTILGYTPVPTTRTISTTSPLSGGGDLSANRTLSIADAVADGTTKGAAAFTAADFNSAAGVISIDYTNGQSASGSNKGFLTSADWTRFDSFKTQTIGVTVDGSGGVITAGNKGYVRIPYACTITFWSIITTGGGSGASLSFDILRANNAIPTLSIIGAGGNKPSVSGSTQLSSNTAPSGWTSTALSANDILAFNVDAGAAVYSWAILQLTITRT